jgi:amidase/aspartyl-tRNA(Asn)/glutamyl-tRNA(Gln) amidotransferase subunit A
MTSTDVSYRSAGALAADIEAGVLSPVEVMDATLERIEEREPSLNAIVYRGFDEARESARAAQEAVSRGETGGTLRGVPVLMKDLFDFKPGWPATFGGIPAMADFTLDAYCVWAERMEAAGAIIVGKGNSPALGFRGACDNYLFGPTSNPFDTTKNSGGSSGGSAAVVADGLVPIAEGTDGGGSIRIPAAWCGVVGYQPSAGRVPSLLRPNAFSGVSPFIYEGPITRNVADAALAMNVLAGPHPGDPFCALDKPDFESTLDSGVEGWKIAYSPDLGVYPVQAEVAALVEEAVRAFEEAGAEVVEVDIEIDLDQRELSDLWCRLIMPLSLDAFANLKAGGLDLLGEHRSDLPPEVLYWANHVAGMSAMEYFDDNSKRTKVFDALQAVMADHRVLVSPTLACMPEENLTTGETCGPKVIEGVEVDHVIGWCMTYFTNFTGYPAVSLPAGLSGGLPVGLQVIGGRGADLDVLAASAAFERARPWDHIYEIPANRSLT